MIAEASGGIQPGRFAATVVSGGAVTDTRFEADVNLGACNWATACAGINANATSAL